MEKEPAQIVHYIHRMRYSTQERLVGVFVLSGLALIFLLLFINSRTAHLFEDRITLNAYLNKAEGLSTETPVKISGIDVGKIKSIDIDPRHRIHVRLTVYKRYQTLVRTDSRAAIGKLSVLGKSVINITAGSTNKTMLNDGAFIDIEEPLSVEEMLAEMTPVIRAVETSVQRFADLITQIEPTSVSSIVSDLQNASKNIREVSAQINDKEGALGTIIYDTEFKKRFTDGIASFDKAFTQAEQRLREMQTTVGNVNTVSGNLSKSSERLPEISDELTDMLNNSNTALTNINIELKQLPDLITRMNVLMEQTDRLLEGLNNSWLFSGDETQTQRKLIGVQPYHE